MNQNNTAMTHIERLNELRNSTKKTITDFLEAQPDKKYMIFDLEDKDDEEKTDEFYSLPQENIFLKYYSVMHYIHTLYLKEGEIVFIGYDVEDAENRELEFSWVFTDTLCQIADMLDN